MPGVICTLFISSVLITGGNEYIEDVDAVSTDESVCRVVKFMSGKEIYRTEDTIRKYEMTCECKITGITADSTPKIVGINKRIVRDREVLKIGKDQYKRLKGE